VAKKVEKKMGVVVLSAQLWGGFMRGLAKRLKGRPMFTLLGVFSGSITKQRRMQLLKELVIHGKANRILEWDLGRKK